GGKGGCEKGCGQENEQQRQRMRACFRERENLPPPKMERRHRGHEDQECDTQDMDLVSKPNADNAFRPNLRSDPGTGQGCSIDQAWNLQGFQKAESLLQQHGTPHLTPQSELPAGLTIGSACNGTAHGRFPKPPATGPLPRSPSRHARILPDCKAGKYPRAAPASS